MPDITPRKAGRLGKLAPKQAVGLRWLVDYLTDPLPKAPATLDLTKGVAAWGMLGNDRYGDCTFAGAVHLRMAAAAMVGEVDHWPTADQVVAAYLTYTHGQDVGAVETDLLAYWRTTGILANRIWGSAPVHVTEHAEVKSAIALFGGLYAGIKVPANAAEQFEAHEPWHLTDTEADHEYVGGHCVPLLGYTAKGPLCVTWGAVQAMTWAWWNANADEGHAVLTGEFLTAKPGVVNVGALEADLNKLAA